MGGTGVIDNFLGVFTSYIDSGFGLLGGEVAFIATTLIVIDVTLAALFWSWGADDDIIARLVKKTLFVGVFAYIIGNWNNLARIIFESFAGLGLKASGTGFTTADLLRPGKVAQTGLDAGRPLLDSISSLMGYWSFFENFIQIACMFLAWALVLLAFFILAIQLFVTLIEFKLTTLAGFVLIPFGLFGKAAFPAVLLATSALAGCATTNPPPEISYDNAAPAVQTVDPPAPVTVVELPRPLPLPGQLQPVPETRRAPEPTNPTARVNQANEAARVQPVRDGFINSMQVYPWTQGALYQVYTAVGQITDIALQPGEQLVGAGPVAAGDTVRWIIGDTESGSGATRQIHILVKPTRADLMTNLVINTNMRTYHMELRSTERTYMASVSWQYPQDQLIALRRQNAEAQAAQPVASGVDLANVNFRYAIEGDRAPWRPLRAFDDGRQVFIEFPRGIGQGEMPPLFVVGPEGNTSELVNYRVRGHHMIVDRLFAAAELRFGSGREQKRVRIFRTDGRPTS